MKILSFRVGTGLNVLLALALVFAASSALAHTLRPKGVAVAVAKSPLTVTPALDWNQLRANIGKSTETWTIDGEQLNEVTFFGGIASGQPLMRERSRKRDPLPKFTQSMLLIEVPELLERTYRTYKNLAAFHLISTEPVRFLGREGVAFAYEYTDDDGLMRKGEARAAIVASKLYMITFEAPRLHYFPKLQQEFRAIAESATLPQ